MMLRPLCLALLSLLVLSHVAPAQSPPPAQAQPTAPTVTVSVTPAGVRLAALGQVRQTRLEVYDAAGATVHDSRFQPGNVRDWSPQGLADGRYTCALTARGLDGRLTLRQGVLFVQGGVASLELGGDGGGDAEPQAAVVEADGQGAATLATHDGTDGAVTSTAGALTLRTGDILSGGDREHVRVTEEGRVGIGTTQPEATLDVAGTVRAAGGFRFSDGSTLDTAGGRLRLTSVEGEELPAASTTGTGTQNRLAKWLETGGAGTLGDSALTETGGRLGIGTVSPNFELTLAGADVGVQLVSPTTGTAASDGFRFGIDSTNRAFLFNQEATDLYFATSATERMRILANGNVGIGTSAPTHRLTVGQPETAQFASAQLGIFGEGFAYSIARDTTANVEALFGADFGALGPASGSTVFGSLTNHGIRFVTNNNLKMVINAAGNVGIGTEVPAARLTVSGTGAFNAPGAARFDLFNNGFANTGFLQHVTDAGAWQLATTAGETRLLVNSTGNFGVGTAAPVAPLHVFRSTSDAAAPIAVIASDGNQMPLAFRSGGAEAARIRADSSGNLVLATVGGASKDIFFRAGDDSNASTRVFIDGASGNVGIGTTNPTSRLTVSDTFEMFRPGTTRFTQVVSDENGGTWELREQGNLILKARGSEVAATVRLIAGEKFLIRDLATVNPAPFVLCHTGGDAEESKGVGNCVSSIRYKENLSPFTPGLSLINRLRPVSFNWKPSGMLDFGLVAEAVAEVEPLLVTHNEAGEVQGVKYERLGVVLINALKEQQRQIEELQRQNAGLRARLGRMERARQALRRKRR